MPGLFGILPGAAAGIYLNSGNHNTPTWVEQTSVKDVEPQSPWVYVEGQSRATPVKMYAKATIDLPVKVVMRADEADTEYAAWLAAHWDRVDTIFDLLILNGKLEDVGAQGLRGPYYVSRTDFPQPIDGSIYDTFELRPTIDGAGNLPVSVVMAANNTITPSAITYGDI